MSSSFVTFKPIGMDCNLQLLLMEIDFNKEESTETSKFINFSIREYVNEIRNKNPEKCSPFRSLGDLHKKVVSSYQSESTLLIGQKCPGDDDLVDTTELTEDPNYKIESLGIDNDLRKIVDNGSSKLTSFKVNIGQNQHKDNVDEGANIGHNEAADNNEPGRNGPRRKHRKFRLLSDIYKDPASELRAGCDRINPENVNRRFVTEIEDELDDDVTLAAYFRKQKGVDVTDSTRKNRNIIRVEEPSVDRDRKLNQGFKDAIGKDSNVGVSRKKTRIDETYAQTVRVHNKVFRLECSEKSNQVTKVNCLEAAEKEDSEMEAVMLLARHFNEEKQILRELETNMTCACVKKKIRKPSTQSDSKPAVTKTSSRTATKHAVKKNTKEKLETAFCSVQMNSFMPLKASPGGCFQGHLEVSMMKADGVEAGAQDCETIICSFNRNPADFTMPNGETRFMRRGV